MNWQRILNRTAREERLARYLPRDVWSQERDVCFLASVSRHAHGRRLLGDDIQDEVQGQGQDSALCSCHVSVQEAEHTDARV